MPIATKAIIADAFITLVCRESVDKITVKMLIQECHISRQTFYYHFHDILDVLEWSIRRDTKKLLTKSLEEPDMNSALQVLVAFTVERYPMLQRLMNSQRRYHFEKFLVDSLKDYVLGLVQFHHRKVEVNADDRQAFMDYNAYGLAGVLLARCGDSKLDQDQLTSQLEKMLTRQVLQS